MILSAGEIWNIIFAMTYHKGSGSVSLIVMNKVTGRAGVDLELLAVLKSLWDVFSHQLSWCIESTLYTRKISSNEE